MTPRSAAAVEALGEQAFGIASATVTVARMIGMAIGLAALTAFGSTIIDRLWAAIRATPDAYKAFIPESLRDRAFNDGLVVQALEAWASGEAARILVGVFLVAAAVMAVAVLPRSRWSGGAHRPRGRALSRGAGRRRPPSRRCAAVGFGCAAFGSVGLGRQEVGDDLELRDRAVRALGGLHPQALGRRCRRRRRGCGCGAGPR